MRRPRRGAARQGTGAARGGASASSIRPLRVVDRMARIPRRCRGRHRCRHGTRRARRREGRRRAAARPAADVRERRPATHSMRSLQSVVRTDCIPARCLRRHRHGMRRSRRRAGRRMAATRPATDVRERRSSAPSTRPVQSVVRTGCIPVRCRTGIRYWPGCCASPRSSARRTVRAPRAVEDSHEPRGSGMRLRCMAPAGACVAEAAPDPRHRAPHGLAAPRSNTLSVASPKAARCRPGRFRSSTVSRNRSAWRAMPRSRRPRPVPREGSDRA